MDLDDLLYRYFRTSNLSEASPTVQKAGLDRLRVDFGLESYRARATLGGLYFTCSVRLLPSILLREGRRP